MNPRLTAIIFLLCAPPAMLVADDSAPRRQLEHFFKYHDVELKLVVNAVKNARDQEGMRTQIREEFGRQWIARLRKGLSLAEFDELAKVCQPFGPGNNALVDLLEGPNPPAAFANPEFRAYVRDRLPLGAARRLQRVPAVPQKVIERLAFLKDVLPADDAEQVFAAFLARIAEATPSQMAAYHKALNGLPPGWRFNVDEIARRIRKTLGKSLYQRQPNEWHLAGDALPALVAASDFTVSSFFGKAVAYFRQRPADRDPAAGVLAVLADLMEDAEAFKLLEPGSDARWFAWLHTAPVFQKMHNTPGLLDDSYRILRGFPAGDFGVLFPGTVLYYYGKAPYTERIFADLIRPQAKGPHAMAVLGTALDGKLQPAHREILARDVLAGGDPLAPSWPQPGAPLRLELAVTVYSRLLGTSPAPSAVDDHLARPLLDEIVSGFLDLLRRSPPPTGEIVRHMKTLASHLEDCQRHGGKTASAGPLLRLDREISADLAQAIASIAGAGADSRIAVVDRFVERLTVALRVRALVARAMGQPAWLTLVRETLRQRVFGIADRESNRTLYWGIELTGWRASVLERIDRPLRDVLAETVDGNETELWFRDVYLPLVRVHGLLRILREHNPASYPHLDWVRSDARRKAERLREMFEALQTDRWVDAQGVVQELAREHWEMLGRPNLWTLPPDSFYAGRWGVNANVCVYKGFLDADPPPAGGNWQTPAIAAKAVDELAANHLPVAPVFPSDSGTSDQQETLWTSWALWAENLVTAAEWQSSPFLSRSGALPWQERLVATGRNDLPFRFGLLGNEVSRRVDGQLRLRLARLLLARADGRDLPRASQLQTVAGVALLLPNHADNAGPGGIEAARAFSVELYRELHEAFAGTAELQERANLARHMMRLYVAARSGARPEPSIDAVLNELAPRQPPPADEAARKLQERAVEEAADIQSERLTLIAMINATVEDSPALARTYIDGQIRALLPPGWSEANSEIILAQFTDVLDRVTEQRVRAFLQLRRRLLTVAGALAGEVGRRAEFTADLERLERSLELVNSHVWFTRRAFNPELYFRLSPEGGEAWWPALVVLAWHDHELQTLTVNALRLYDGPGDERLDRVRGLLYRELLQLNESVFATVMKMTDRGDADRILASHHTIPWRALNLHLLAESQGTEEASPAALASDCFLGLLTNNTILGIRLQPSDEMVWQKLFGSVDYFLPAERRRNTSLMVNLDQAVLLADTWAHADKIPALLRAAANAFASANDERAKELLAGAATPGGVMRAFHEILARIGQKPERPGYVNFYANAFTVGGQTLSANLTRALAAPFFRANVPAQMSFVGGLLDGWRQHAQAGPANSAADKAYRRTFDSVLERLVRGTDRSQDAPYIWGPVDRLRAETGLRQDKPAEFLQVAKWLLDLETRYPEPELGRLFRRGGKQ